MTHHDVGRWGEELAARFLESKGWTVLDRNWRLGRHEIDLVACREDVLAFVEVKTRSGPRFGHPLEAITARKRREIERVARGWLGRHPPVGGGLRQRTVRFDAVAVVGREDGEPVIEHVEDAWRVDGPG